MRCLIAVGLLSASLSCSGAVYAQEASEKVVGVALPAPIVITPELVEAHQAYQLAQLRWQQYRFVDLPRQRQLLKDQLRLGESEIQVLKRRKRDYRPFLLVGQYSPVRNDAEDNQLALLAVEQQVRLLRTERINLMRYSRQNARLYQLEVLRSAARVLAVQQAQFTANHVE